MVISADARLCAINYTNDQIWELVLREGKLPTLTLQTTFGLRVKWLRLFPCFVYKDRLICNPADYAQPPQLLTCYTNYLKLSFSPFTGVDALIEYWVPESNIIAGRVSLMNQTAQQETFQFQWAGLLNPMDENAKLVTNKIEDQTVLLGKTNGLSIACVISEHPLSATGPFPALGHHLELPPMGSREITWALATSPDNLETSIQRATSTLEREWEAEISRIELTNAHDQIEIITGDPEWNDAFSLTRQIAYSLITSPSNHLPYSSFVLARQPDHGFSLHGDGMDYTMLWNGQSPLDAYYLANLILPGGVRFIEGILKNFFVAQDETGFIDCKPGLAGQRMRQLALPILAHLAMKIDQHKPDHSWLEDIYPFLARFLKLWFAATHDRDVDGFPELDHPMQFGLEESPIINRWHPQGQGLEITRLENPALAALLYNECKALAKIASTIGYHGDLSWLEEKADQLQGLLKTLWDNKTCIYHYRDFQTHQYDRGTLLIKIEGKNGRHFLHQKFKTPQRFLIRITTARNETCPLTIVLDGKCYQEKIIEKINVNQLQWTGNRAHITTQKLFTQLRIIEVEGLQERDTLEIKTPDYTLTDISCFLPLWAKSATADQARKTITKTLKRRFLKPYGFCISADMPNSRSRSLPPWRNVSLPWNQLVGEALLTHHQQSLAAELVTRIMKAIVQNLKKFGCFFEFIDAQTGNGSGERNHLRGLAPIGLFLAVLGVYICSNREVILQGFNPFPWPVIVKYQGMTVARRSHETQVTFPTGQVVCVNNQELPVRITLP